MISYVVIETDAVNEQYRYYFKDVTNAKSFMLEESNKFNCNSEYTLTTEEIPDDTNICWVDEDYAVV